MFGLLVLGPPSLSLGYGRGDDRDVGREVVVVDGQPGVAGRSVVTGLGCRIAVGVAGVRIASTFSKTRVKSRRIRLRRRWAFR